MKKIFQTRFGYEGNCFQACLASVFDCEALEDMPDIQPLMLRKECNWMLQTQKMLIKRFCATLNFVDSEFPVRYPDEVYLQTVINDSFGLFHQTIFQGGRCIHDPNPHKTSLLPSGNYNLLDERLIIFYAKKVQHMDGYYKQLVETGILSDAVFTEFFGGDSTIEDPFIFPKDTDWNRKLIKHPVIRPTLKIIP